MGIQVNWADETKSAIIIAFQSPWTWDDFSASNREMIAMLDGSDKLVDIIFDIRNGGFPPSGAMKRFKQVAETKHPNGGQLIFVAPKLLTQVVRSTLDLIKIAFMGAFDAPDFIFVTNLDEAKVRVAANRASTTPKKP